MQLGRCLVGRGSQGERKEEMAMPASSVVKRARKRFSMAKRKIEQLTWSDDSDAITVEMPSVDELSIAQLRKLQRHFFSLSHYLKVAADSSTILSCQEKAEDDEPKRKRSKAHPFDAAEHVGCFTGEEKTAATPPAAEPPPVQEAKPETAGNDVQAQARGSAFMPEPGIGERDAREGDEDPFGGP